MNGHIRHKSTSRTTMSQRCMSKNKTKKNGQNSRGNENLNPNYEIRHKFGQGLTQKQKKTNFLSRKKRKPLQCVNNILQSKKKI